METVSTVATAARCAAPSDLSAPSDPSEFPSSSDAGSSVGDDLKKKDYLSNLLFYHQSRVTREGCLEKPKW